MANLLAKRFDEISAEAEKLIASAKPETQAYTSSSKMEIGENNLINWETKAASLLRSACGEDSEHYARFIKQSERQSFDTNLAMLKRAKAVFEAAHDDFDGGYLSSVRTLVQAEVFDTELEQATELLSKGYRVAAAVITGTVLETAVRELCTKNGIAYGKLDKMNADLAKANVYSVLVQKRITALADIRNNAAHGHPNQFTDDDVKDMIFAVERFLVDYLSQSKTANRTQGH